MKISDKIKSLFQRRPRTADELAARAEALAGRAEAQSELEQIRVDARNNQPSP
jgi:hypothetical protein